MTNSNQILKIHDIKKYCIINELSNDIMEIMIDSLMGWTDLNSLYNKIDKLNAKDINDKVTNEANPKHYTKYKWEPIDFILEFELDFCKGCVVKYLSRFQDKAGKADLEKVKFYSCCIKTGNTEHYRKYKKYMFTS
jgi:hypothetical protein